MQGDSLDLQLRAFRKGPLATNDFEGASNEDFRAKVAHVLHGRTLLEYVAQVGLSKQQAMSMSFDQITAFTVAADERETQNPNGPHGYKAKSALPSHFVLDE